MGLHQQAPRKDSNGLMMKKENVVRYMECRKNHAVGVGGYAVDGCREFMASTDEGKFGALICAACGCDRSFHKREVETQHQQQPPCDCASRSTASPP